MKGLNPSKALGYQKQTILRTSGVPVAQGTTIAQYWLAARVSQGYQNLRRQSPRKSSVHKELKMMSIRESTEYKEQI